MQLPAPCVALVALLVCSASVQARPDGAMPAASDAAMEPTPPTTNLRELMHGGDVDSSSSGEEDNMTVQGKAASLCPPRQPELLALEAECAREEHKDCSSTAAPQAETTAEAAEAGGAATTTEAAPTSTEAPAATPTPDDAPRPARRQRKRTCNYHQCVLKKLEVLDSLDMPDKTLLTNWIANNITDEKQKEKLQQRFTECVSSLKDIFGEASDNSKSTEEDTEDDKKNEETQPKKKSCMAAKKVISCLSKSVECPVLKF